MGADSHILGLAGTVAATFFIFALNRGLKMKEDKRPLAEFVWVAFGLLPLAAVCVIWANMEGLSLATRIVIFIVGAALGGFGLLGAAEWLKPAGPAFAQPATGSATSMPVSVAEAMRQRDMEERKRFVDEVLADPSISAETKATLSHQYDLLPFKDEYRQLHGNVSAAQFKSSEAVAFLNRRLQETGKNWRITPENLDATFGTIMINSSMNGPYSAGVKISGGGGNTFDQIDIHGAQTGLDLENTKNNKFSNTRISGPKSEEK